MELREFLEFLYPKYSYKGKFVTFNRETKVVKYFKYEQLDDLIKYVNESENKEETIQVNLSLGNEQFNKIQYIKDNRSQKDVIEKLYRSVTKTFISKEEKVRLSKELKKIEKNEKKYGVKLTSKKRDIEEKLLKYEEMVKYINDNNIKETHKELFNEIVQSKLNYARGVIEGCTELFGIWLDIDINIEGHHSKNNNQFNSFESALEFVLKQPIKPNLVVNTGGGLHIYYKFKDMIHFKDENEIYEINYLYELIGDYFYEEAKKENCEGSMEIPNLMKMMRLPNTYNRKTDNKKKVKVIYENDVFNDISEYYDLVKEIKEQKDLKRQQDKENRKNIKYDDNNKADSELIYEKCAYVKYFVDNMDETSQFEWWSMIRLAIKCENGREVAHKWSENDDRYDFYETENTIDNIISKDYKPFRCDSVKSDLCKDCPFFNKINSPIKLGFLNRNE